MVTISNYYTVAMVTMIEDYNTVAMVTMIIYSVTMETMIKDYYTVAVVTALSDCYIVAIVAILSPWQHSNDGPYCDYQSRHINIRGETIGLHPAISILVFRAQ